MSFSRVSPVGEGRLQQQATQKTWKGFYEEEVKSRRICGLTFFWPEKPTEAMLELGEGKDHRLWRCVYHAGTFSDLAFDD